MYSIKDRATYSQLFLWLTYFMSTADNDPF